MKVFTIAGPKGGCGKTVTTTALAVRATNETGRVAMLDMNEGQSTLTEWWTLRGRPVNPFLHEAEGTVDLRLAPGFRGRASTLGRRGNQVPVLPATIVAESAPAGDAGAPNPWQGRRCGLTRMIRKVPKLNVERQ